MDDNQQTRRSLILRIQNGHDSLAWAQFIDIYSPLVYRFARRQGLQDADAADVVQDVFRTVARAIKGFDCDPARGSFRSWLMTVTRSRLCDHLACQKRQASPPGDIKELRQLEQTPARADDEAYWEEEHQKCVFQWAVTRVRPAFQEATWLAFWQTAVEGKSAKEVATSLSMTVGAVYIAKCRVLAKLKETIAEVDT